ncbi:MAG TPA: F0F1 ATP synthase subunit epsilon [Thermomicrobiales bacterium]|nr:F0F1 ATP synthase subunit epsilon [Thermomicrobiales bacterium]
MANLSVEIVTGERVVYEQDDVSMVVAPGAEGTLGILPSHAPLVSLLQEGELRVRSGAGEESLAIYGGFLEVVNNKVLILSDSAERSGEIDLERAEAARARAEETLRNVRDTQDMAEAEAALRRASIRLRIARNRRQRGQERPAG